MGIFFKWNIEKGIMLNNSGRIDTNGLPPDKGFLTNSPLPDQQNYKCRTKFNAQGLGGDRRAWNLPRHGNYSFLWTIISDLTVVKTAAQVRGQIEVHFHLLGLRYKAYKFHSIHIYFLQSSWMPMFFQISTLSSVHQHIFLHPAGNVFHLQS